MKCVFAGSDVEKLKSTLGIGGGLCQRAIRQLGTKGAERHVRRHATGGQCDGSVLHPLAGLRLHSSVDRRPGSDDHIDVMNLAGFCRNCLSKWYAAAAGEQGLDIDKEAAREIVYGMPYKEWQAKYQTEASPEKQAAWEERQKTLEH